MSKKKKIFVAMEDDEDRGAVVSRLNQNNYEIAFTPAEADVILIVDPKVNIVRGLKDEFATPIVVWWRKGEYEFIKPFLEFEGADAVISPAALYDTVAQTIFAYAQ